MPAKEKSNGHEIFKPRVVEGIKNINKNNRVPIKPKIKTKFDDGISKTVEWYLKNSEFFSNISKKLFVKRLGSR